MLPEGIHRIPLPTPFQIGDVNAWLLRGEPLTLVDAGPLMEETEARLDAGLAALGVAVEDLELIVLTHQHDDHVGLAGELRRRSGAEVAGIAPLAAFLADSGASMDADDAYSVALMRRHGVTEKTVATLHGISRAFRRFVADVPVARVIADGRGAARRRAHVAGARAPRAQPDRHGAGLGRRAPGGRPPAGAGVVQPDRARAGRRARPGGPRRLPGAPAHAPDIRPLPAGDGAPPTAAS